MLHCLDKSSKHEDSTQTKIIFPIDLLTSQRASAHFYAGLVCATVNTSDRDQIFESYGIQVSPSCCLATSLKRGAESVLRVRLSAAVLAAPFS